MNGKISDSFYIIVLRILQFLEKNEHKDSTGLDSFKHVIYFLFFEEMVQNKKWDLLKICVDSVGSETNWRK